MDKRKPDCSEPHFPERDIRWNDTLETLERRIVPDMDSDTEINDEISLLCEINFYQRIVIGSDFIKIDSNISWKFS